MKFKLILAVFILLSFGAYSQESRSKNVITFIYGAASTQEDSHGTDGDFFYRVKGGMTIGLTYTRNFGRHFSVEAGGHYAADKYTMTSTAFGGLITKNGTIQMISAEAFAKYNFYKYLFIDVGLSVDGQSNYHDSIGIFDQSGISAEGGFGGKVKVGQFIFTLNPYIRGHSVLALGRSSANNQLTTEGVKFGVGFSF